MTQTVVLGYLGSSGDKEEEVPLAKAIEIVENALKKGKVVIRIGKKGTKFIRKPEEVKAASKEKKKFLIGNPIRGG